MLVETKESDMFDNKKRSRARMHLNAARQTFEAIMRLILEAHGVKSSDCQVPVYQFVALPNVREMPLKSQSKSQQQSSSASDNQANTSTSSIGSATDGKSSSVRPNRALSYLIKSDLEDHGEFMKWWKKSVEEPSRLLAEAKKEEDEKKREKMSEEEKEKEREKEKEKKVDIYKHTLLFE